jgi:hypothetical protein
MAVVVPQKFTGSTLDHYDLAAAKLGMTAEGPHIAPGLLFHYVVATDEGVEITDIWTTREGFEKRRRDSSVRPVVPFRAGG